MPQHTEDDRWMTLALQLARRGLYTSSPNPRVGCVIVKNATLLASGFHARAGEPHAERNALKQLSAAQTRGACAYVTLEPCSHTGRTGPCADALIAAGIGRVVVAMTDPNPKVAGAGIERLRAAGIDVIEGVQEAQARSLNPGFIKRFNIGRPKVTLKLAMSLDGRTAMRSGESFWITGAAAREDVQRLRARSCAIVTGMGTFETDDPSLTVRPADWQRADYGSDWVRQPLRVLLDSAGRADMSRKLFQAAGEVLVVTANAASVPRFQEAGIEAIALGRPAAHHGEPPESPAGSRPAVDLDALIDTLAERSCNEVLIEAGATLAAAFIEADLIDELVVYQAPVLLGQTARPLIALDIASMTQKRPLELLDERRLGNDHRFVYRLDQA